MLLCISLPTEADAFELVRLALFTCGKLKMAALLRLDKEEASLVSVFITAPKSCLAYVIKCHLILIQQISVSFTG